MKARDVMVSPGTRRRRSRHLALRGTRSAIGAREEWIGDLQQHLGCDGVHAGFLRSATSWRNTRLRVLAPNCRLCCADCTTWPGIPRWGQCHQTEVHLLNASRMACTATSNRYRGSQARRACVARGGLAAAELEDAKAPRPLHNLWPN
jgi:hypothetical protein